MTVHVESNTQLTLEQERVYRLRQALERDGGTPGGFLELLIAVVSDNTWQQVPSGVNSDEPFTSFRDFVEAKPPFGLGHSAEGVFALLKIRHPRESVADFRIKLEAMRAEVSRLLAADGVTDYSESQRINEIKAWNAVREHGGWWLAFFVACQVGAVELAGDDPVDSTVASYAVPKKLTVKRFAEVTGVSVSEIVAYYRAWDAAYAAGLVDVSASNLYPGCDLVGLPAAAAWPEYFGPDEVPAARDGWVESDALTGSSRPSPVQNAASICDAILADAKAADVARTALMRRANEDMDLQAAMVQDVASQPELKKALAAENRRLNQAKYVRKVAERGSVRTSAGLVVNLPEHAKADAAQQLRKIEGGASAASVEAAYQAMHALIEEVLDGDPDIHEREQRSRIHKVLNATVKSISAIDPAEVAAVADDSVRAAVVALQSKINDLAVLFSATTSETHGES